MNDLNLTCNTLVVKVASRCNLNCTYCYMYHGGDNTWKKQPKVMAYETIQSLANRVKEHCLEHSSENMNIILHGGEPLLAGKEFFENFISVFNKTLSPSVKLHFNLQTNGILLNEEWCVLFSKLNISIGISLDGVKNENDLFRVYHSGKGSYDDIIKGYKTALHSPSLKNKPGFLSVINVNADPVATYLHFKQLETRIIDFLLPDANYNSLPPKKQKNASLTPYADWLISIFDIWIKESEETRTRIRTFEIIIELILGSNLSFESWGSMHNDVLVIETDGGIEAVDGLKICGEGFTKAGANVSTHSFDEAMKTPVAQLYIMGHKYLCKKCLACPINDICGGGSIQTRYSKNNGFDNPSIYCNDLLKLVTHIQNSVIDTLPTEFVTESGIKKLQYEDAVDIINDNMCDVGESHFSEFLLNF